MCSLVNHSHNVKLSLLVRVPQGSVFGKLLFLTYVNDITDTLLSITRLFTDDTSLATTTTNVEEMQGIINHRLSEITKWSKQ